MKKLSELTDKERGDLALWFRGLVADERFQVLLDELELKIESCSANNNRCKEENAWDRGYVIGLTDARKMPFDIIETCGTDQDTSET